MNATLTPTWESWLAAILDDPADMTRRAALLDWMQETDPARYDANGWWWQQFAAGQGRWAVQPAETTHRKGPKLLLGTWAVLLWEQYDEHRSTTGVAAAVWSRSPACEALVSGLCAIDGRRTFHRGRWHCRTCLGAAEGRDLHPLDDEIHPAACDHGDAPGRRFDDIPF